MIAFQETKPLGQRNAAFPPAYMILGNHNQHVHFKRNAGNTIWESSEAFENTPDIMLLEGFENALSTVEQPPYQELVVFSRSRCQQPGRKTIGHRPGLKSVLFPMGFARSHKRSGAVPVGVLWHEHGQAMLYSLFFKGCKPNASPGSAGVHAQGMPFGFWDSGSRE